MTKGLKTGLLATAALLAGTSMVLAEARTITVWAGGTSETSMYRITAIEMAADIVEREAAVRGEDLQITIENRVWNSWEDFKQAVTLASESGNAPNILVTGHEDIGPWSEAGIIRPIEDYVDMNAWPLSQLYPNLVEVSSYEGQVWGIPQDSEARAFFFSRAHLKSIGYTDADIDALPGKVQDGSYTLYSMLNDTKKMQDAGVVAAGDGFAPRNSNGVDYWQFYQSFGGDMSDLETGKLVLDREALRGMYQFFVDAVAAGVVSPTYLGRDFDDFMSSVASGRHGAWHGGTFHVPRWLTQYGLEDFFGTIQATLIPAGNERGRANSITHPIVYLISSSGSDDDAILAADLIAVASEPRINSLHAVKSAHLAIGTEQVNVPLFANDRWTATANELLLPYANAMPNDSDFGVYWTAMYKGLEASWTGSTSVDAAVEAVEAEVVAALGDAIIVR